MVTAVTEHKPFHVGKLILYIILILAAAIFVYPIIWLFLNSLKTTPEFYMNPWGLPTNWLFSNYISAWVVSNMGRYLLNSFIVIACTLLISILFGTMASYAISRLKWKASGAVMGFFLIGMMVPIHATLIPLFMMFQKLRLTNSLISLIIAYATFALPITIFILSGFFNSIPREIEEAAVIDGCSVRQVFLKVIIPISSSAILTVLIFNFITYWNELLVALTFISNENNYTIPVGLTNFQGQYSTNYASMFAAIIIAIIPSIIIYVAFNSKIVAGVTAGAVKG